MAISIRPAIPDDARAIAEVHVASWRSAYRGLVPEEVLARLSIDEREQMWRNGLAGDEPGSALVAEDAGRIIGFVGFGPSRDDEAPDGVGEVYALYVLPERWRSGDGRRLLEVAERSLREAGFHEARLWVLDTNEPRIASTRRWAGARTAHAGASTSRASSYPRSASGDR